VSDDTQSKWKAAVRKAAAFFVRWELAFVVVLAPLFLFPPLGRAWLLLLLLLLPGAWLVALAGGEPIRSTPLNGSLLVIAVMVLVSVGATYDVALSTPKVLGVVFGIAMFFAIVRTVGTRVQIGLALNIFVIGGVALAAIGLLGTHWAVKMPVIREITARMPAVIRGVPGQSEGFHPNAVAGALVMFIPLQLALAIVSRPSRWTRAAHLAGLAFIGGTLLLTQSRGGIISLAAGLAMWAVWHNRRTRIAGLAALLVLAIVLAVAIPRGESVIVPYAGRGLHADVIGRTELWSRALAGIEDFPFTGMGMNTFRRVLPVFYPPFLMPRGEDVAHAHNHLLQAALDLGLPGLIAYLALWFGAAALLVITIRQSASTDTRLIAGGFAAGMFSYFLFGTGDAIALGAKVGVFFWIALALIVVLYESRTSAEIALPSPS
jgi:putative inorganic carbon (HCO3(-)) transporter